MATHEQRGRIGPNAIIQTHAAIAALEGGSRADAVLAMAGLGHYAGTPPASMVREAEVMALMTTLRGSHDPSAANAIALIAGQKTGDYLLANRIPAPAQRLLRLLPPVLASRALLSAIRRHTWTFAGSGQVVMTAGHPVLIDITGCPLCRNTRSDAACCGYFAATFERLFRALVHHAATVRETVCTAQGGAVCRFEVQWPGWRHTS